MTRRSKLTCLITALVALSALIPSASAQGVGLATNRNLIDISVIAGGSFQDDLTVFNNSPDQALPIAIEVVMWTLNEDTDEIEFIRAEESLNASLWFDFEPNNFIIDPGRSRDVIFSVSPPKTAAPGSYLAMIRLKPVLPDFYFTEEGPRFIPEIGIPVFIGVHELNLDGTVNMDAYQATFLTLGTPDKSIPILSNLFREASAGVFDSAIEKLIARIRNEGIYHFRMMGVVEVKNVFGKVVERQDLPGRYFIPSKSREIEISVLPTIDEDKLSSWNLFWSKLGRTLKSNAYIGPYSATVLMNMPNGAVVSESIKFWVLPWKLWLGILLLIFFTAFWIRPFGKRLRAFLRVLIKGKY